MNIFEALRESHEIQRDLSEQLVQTSGDTPERTALFADLKNELAAHELAEDRHFYAPLMQHDAAIDLCRHAIAEHHEMDEMVEELEGIEQSSPAWLVKAKLLADKVHHHLKEEEQKFFQQAGKILTEKQKTDLADKYLKEYDSQKSELSHSAN